MRTRARQKTAKTMQTCNLGTCALQKISAKNDTDLRKVEQMLRNKPVENDKRTKAARKPPRKTNMRTEVPKKHRNRRKTI